jgi:hypothetical protein
VLFTKLFDQIFAVQVYFSHLGIKRYLEQFSILEQRTSNCSTIGAFLTHGIISTNTTTVLIIFAALSPTVRTQRDTYKAVVPELPKQILNELQLSVASLGLKRHQRRTKTKRSESKSQI